MGVGQTQEEAGTALLAHYATNTLAVVAVVVGGVDVGAVEVGVVGVVATVDRAGPVVPVGRPVVQRAAVDVASADKEQSVLALRVAR